jgi:hypothetical protein
MVVLAPPSIFSTFHHATKVIAEVRLLLSCSKHIFNCIGFYKLALRTDGYTGVAKQYVR